MYKRQLTYMWRCVYSTICQYVILYHLATIDVPICYPDPAAWVSAHQDLPETSATCTWLAGIYQVRHGFLKDLGAYKALENQLYMGLYIKNSYK